MAGFLQPSWFLHECLIYMVNLLYFSCFLAITSSFIIGVNNSLPQQRSWLIHQSYQNKLRFAQNVPSPQTLWCSHKPKAITKITVIIFNMTPSLAISSWTSVHKYTAVHKLLNKIMLCILSGFCILTSFNLIVTQFIARNHYANNPNRAVTKFHDRLC